MNGASDNVLTVLDQLPSGLLDLPAERLHEMLPGPTLIELPGSDPQPLFISVLLHGNETTGWDAMRAILKKYPRLPRTLYLLIGNVSAAARRQRHLPDQADYNRIWKGDGDGPEHAMARQLLHRLEQRPLFAAIDIHNNTGTNPHYACINRLNEDYLHLATLFSRTVVYFLKPDGVLSLALSRRCPAVTLECGKPDDAHGVTHVIEYVEAALHLSAFPEHEVAPQDVDLFHTVAVVKVPEQLSIGVDDPRADIDLSSAIDHYNFSELPVGTCFGHYRHGGDTALEARDELGNEVSGRYFELSDGRIYTRTPVMPSMLTLDTGIIRQDCLCYLMERLPLPTGE
ncbi:M14 family metallopeptidase [Thiohalophilus thiocyanatoxydans]|uniref:Succinylglutamate desuccinylase n=1 Tax=Thiohalophilus thiocyanatoxydans TaxID=381308 RepID=A0A4R8J1X1_9GAMM|nr:M14 family metallopeptidase [Thiohalophilus thiocyanatoxydans]TDY04327.1 succinylglutamate desuccinylase [Thiohalophilus thiocyanatoxydans]